MDARAIFDDGSKSGSSSVEVAVTSIDPLPYVGGATSPTTNAGSGACDRAAEGQTPRPAAGFVQTPGSVSTVTSGGKSTVVFTSCATTADSFETLIDS